MVFRLFAGERNALPRPMTKRDSYFSGPIFARPKQIAAILYLVAVFLLSFAAVAALVPGLAQDFVAEGPFAPWLFTFGGAVATLGHAWGHRSRYVWWGQMGKLFEEDDPVGYRILLGAQYAWAIGLMVLGLVLLARV